MMDFEELSFDSDDDLLLAMYNYCPRDCQRSLRPHQRSTRPYERATCPLESFQSLDDNSTSQSLQRETESQTPRQTQRTLSVSDEGEEQPTTSTEAVKDSSGNWRDQYTHVKDVHLHAMRNKYLSDVTFIVGEEKVPFSAHRIILALGSPVFEAMFFGGLAEKGEAISIPDVDPKGFDCLLRFLYNEDIVIENDVVAFKTFFAADKYCVMSLKDRCEQYLIRCKLKVSNVWVFLESSLFLNADVIKIRCLLFLKHATKSALEDNSFLDCTSKTLETLLSLNVISVSEMVLILHLIRWASHKSELEQDPDGSFPHILMPLLKLVRFHNLSHTDFVSLLRMPKVKDVFSESDALAILKSIIQPAIFPLPSWCSPGKYRPELMYDIELDVWPPFATFENGNAEIIYPEEDNHENAYPVNANPVNDNPVHNNPENNNPINDEQGGSSQCQNRNKRKRIKPQKVEIYDFSSASSPLSYSDVSDACTVCLSP